MKRLFDRLRPVATTIWKHTAALVAVLRTDRCFNNRAVRVRQRRTADVHLLHASLGAAA
jgi:hypothetical protein